MQIALVCLCNQFLVLAGAEDVMSDLGVRQAMKKMPSTARL